MEHPVTLTPTGDKSNWNSGMKNAGATIEHQGAPSYWLRTDKMELFVTEQGGHMGPVQYKLKHRWVSPMSVAPWLPEEVHSSQHPPVLRLLRGDFFCFPFGMANGSLPDHGRTANENWELKEASVLSLTLFQELAHNKGSIQKRISLEPEERAVYQEHLIQGLQGRYSYGYHAMLDFSSLQKKGFFNCGALKWGQVKPGEFTNPAIGEYSCLQPGAAISDLERVPLANGGYTNLHEYPSREGFEDLVMLSQEHGSFAWNAATMDGYVWLSLKNPRTLPCTLLWFSNGGRHQAPWSGRHRARLGIEEVCSFFNEGLEASRKSPLADKSIPTVRHFNRRSSVSIRSVHVVHQVARNFGMVVDVETVEGEREVIITGSSGISYTVPVNWSFLYEGPE